jgi:hypothetical protein
VTPMSDGGGGLDPDVVTTDVCRIPTLASVNAEVGPPPEPAKRRSRRSAAAAGV